MYPEFDPRYLPSTRSEYELPPLPEEDEKVSIEEIRQTEKDYKEMLSQGRSTGNSYSHRFGFIKHKTEAQQLMENYKRQKPLQANGVNFFTAPYLSYISQFQTE